MPAFLTGGRVTPDGRQSSSWGDELGKIISKEIAAEGFVRNLPRFSHFLRSAALTNGALLNFSETASDVGISPATVREHYRILEDTLIGYLVEPLRKQNSRKEISTARFHSFDTGVTNTLRSVKRIEQGTAHFGEIFEQFSHKR